MWWRALAYKRKLCDSLYIQKRKAASSCPAGADGDAEEAAPASAATTAPEANSQSSGFSQQLGVLYKLDEKRKKTESRLRFAQEKVRLARAELETAEGDREKSYQSAIKRIDRKQADSRVALEVSQKKVYAEFLLIQAKEKREMEKKFEEEKSEKKKKIGEETRGRTTLLTEEKKTALAECERLHAEIGAGEKDIKVQTEKLATLV